MTQEPLDHILRPRLPWREDDLTECGRAANDVKTIITADELKARIKRLGQQRTAFTVCMTCAGQVKYSMTWEQHPIGVLDRELKRVGTFTPTPGYPVALKVERVTAELRAIAALIDAHRGEFDGYLSGLGDTVDLAGARRRRARGGAS